VSVAGTGYANWSIGSYIELDTVMVNRGDLLGAYFDGSSGGGAYTDGVPSWDGTAGLSSSSWKAPYAFGWMSGNAGYASLRSAGGTGALVSTYQTMSQGFSGAYSDRMRWWQAPTDDADVVVGGTGALTIGANAVPGAAAVASIYAYPSKNQRLKARVVINTGSGPVTVDGVAVAAVGGQWNRLTVSYTAPADAGTVSVFIVSTAGAGYSRWAAGDSIMCDAAMITLGLGLYDYFDGNTADTDLWDYAYYAGVLYGIDYTIGTDNYSRPSIRYAIPQPDSVSVLADPDLPVLPTPPAPPTIPNLAISPQYEYIRYYLPIPSINVPEWAAGVPTIVLSTATTEIRQARIRFYPNAANLASDLVDPATYCGEFIVSYLPAGAALTIDGIDEVAYAVFNGTTEQIVADQLLYGTDGSPVDWPELSCGLPSLMTVDIPPTEDIANLHIVLVLTRRE
jgi:hypothetical protein